MPTLEEVKTYYDERIGGKIRDFTEFNPRIEAAVAGIAEWAPLRPRRILEIGCGIGASSWRMARAWPDAEVIGADVSPESIGVAKSCFQRENLSYHEGLVTKDTFSGHFDLIVLMDVYEHIAVEDRCVLHQAIREYLAPEESRVFVSVPTPDILDYSRVHNPEGIQPVDENIGLPEVATFLGDTETRLIYWRELGIWRYGDYTHFVAGRYQVLSSVERRETIINQGLRASVARLLTPRKLERANYLGTDVGLARSFHRMPLKVSKRERVRLVTRGLGEVART